MQHRSLERSLAVLGADPVGRALLAGSDVDALSQGLAADDPYGESRALSAAASLAGPGVDPQGWLRHRLWCAARRAQDGERTALRINVDGDDHLAETRGHPTVLVTPMTLDTADALAVVATLFPDRRRIVYGHDVTAADVGGADVEVADQNGAVRQILAVLDGGGVYCTYGDFSYAGHASTEVTLLGRPRRLSLGWVRIAARDGTMLLPLTLVRSEASGVTAHVGEPVQVRGTGPVTVLARLLATMLEDGVRTAGEQWLLLPTLTFEATEAG